MCRTRLWHVYARCMTCVGHVYDMCWTCVWHVYDMCTTCLWHVCDTVWYAHVMTYARQTIEPNSSSGCVCNDDACDVIHYLTHTWIVIQHMLASPHTAHTNAYSPTSQNQACKAIKESANNSHHTTYNNNHGHCKLSGASLALFFATNPQIARRHLAES